MKLTAALTIIALAALAVAGVALYRASGAVGAATSAAATNDALVASARALAQDELTRLNAAEMIYRNKVYVHVYTMAEAALPPSRQCMKLYRQFKDCDVEDIERTPSLLHPIKFSIRFNFDLIGTRGEPAQRLDPALIKSVQNDHAFVVHKTESIVREYFADLAGKVISRPPLPERPNFFSAPGSAKFGEFRLDDPLKPGASF
jgi:hypothetical protein